MTGTLSNGFFNQKAVFSTNKWTHAAVSRYTLLLYNNETGLADTGRLVDGVYTRWGYAYLDKGYTHVVASCDTVDFLEDSVDNSHRWGGWRATGTLTNGYFQMTSSYQEYADYRVQMLVHTSDSYVRRERTTDYLGWSSGKWGVSTGGSSYVTAGTGDSFGLPAVGTADSVLFYDRYTGDATTATLRNGSFSYSVTYRFDQGWELFAGGR